MILATLLSNNLVEGIITSVPLAAVLVAGFSYYLNLVSTRRKLVADTLLALGNLLVDIFNDFKNEGLKDKFLLSYINLTSGMRTELIYTGVVIECIKGNLDWQSIFCYNANHSHQVKNNKINYLECELKDHNTQTSLYKLAFIEIQDLLELNYKKLEEGRLPKSPK